MRACFTIVSDFLIDKNLIVDSFEPHNFLKFFICCETASWNFDHVQSKDY